MKRVILLLSGFVLLYSLSPLNGQETRELTQLERVVLGASSEAINLFRSEADNIWPGFDLSAQPFIVYIPGEWTLLFNYTGEIEGFEPYPESWPSINSEAKVRFGDFEGLMGQLEFNFNLGNLKTVAIGFPKDFFAFREESEYLMIFSFIVHEAFHQYQREKFGEIPWAREELYPILNIENSSLAYLELKLLADAYQALEADNSRKCKQLFEDFRRIRTQRWKKSEQVAIYEQGQEINEGTAKYVEVKSVLTLRARASEPGLLTDTIFRRVFLSQAASQYVTSDINSRISGGIIPPEDISRNRIYTVGALQGLIHDYLGVDWKDRAEAAGDQFYLFSPGTEEPFAENMVSEKRTDRVKRRYHFSDIYSKTRASIDSYLKDYNDNLKNFESQEGLLTEVRFKYRSLSRSASTRSKKWVVDNGGNTLCNDYRIFRIKSESCSIGLENMAVHQFNEWGKKYTAVKYVVASPVTLIIDSKEQVIENFPEKSFSDLMMMGDGVDIKINSPGRISITGNRLVINVD